MRTILLAIAVLIGSMSAAAAQTSCTANTPCVQVTITNSTMSGQTGDGILWACEGSSTSCTAASLTSAMSGQSSTTLCPSSNSVWTCASFAQSGTTATYNFSVAYSSLWNFAAQNADGGGVGPVSSIVTFQVPAQTATLTAPSIITTLVTNGSVGVQP